MTPKRIASTVLLLFVVASVVYIVVGESQQEAKTNGKDDQAPPVQAVSDTTDAGPAAGAEAGHKLIAYYFHRTKRCRTCLTIQRYAEEALKEAFPEALNTGELEWRTVNVEEPAHEHFVIDYQLTTSELVLVDTENGQQTEWRNLKRIWELVRDELEFKTYVEAEAMVYLEQDS